MIRSNNVASGGCISPDTRNGRYRSQDRSNIPPRAMQNILRLFKGFDLELLHRSRIYRKAVRIAISGLKKGRFAEIKMTGIMFFWWGSYRTSPGFS